MFHCVCSSGYEKYGRCHGNESGPHLSVVLLRAGESNVRFHKTLQTEVRAGPSSAPALIF
jgi:hypothetical protein